ncbi:MAG: hypothetical protein NC293_09720 [Roseburia sp.]|nr:hypothetical protein [Roseburia sp.]
MKMDEPLLQFDYGNAEELEGYRRQLQTLYTTVEGTCPGDRNFGLSPEYQDEPPDVAESTLSLEIYNKTEEYVPQVEVLDIQFAYGEDGQMIPKVMVGLNEEYDEEEYEEEG